MTSIGSNLKTSSEVKRLSLRKKRSLWESRLQLGRNRKRKTRKISIRERNSTQKKRNKTLRTFCMERQEKKWTFKTSSKNSMGKLRKSILLSTLIVLKQASTHLVQNWSKRGNNLRKRRRRKRMQKRKRIRVPNNKWKWMQVLLNNRKKLNRKHHSRLSNQNRKKIKSKIRKKRKSKSLKWLGQLPIMRKRIIWRLLLKLNGLNLIQQLIISLRYGMKLFQMQIKKCRVDLIREKKLLRK